MHHLKWLFTLCFIASQNCYAQNGLTAERQEMFMNRAKMKLEEFQDGLQNIVDNQLRADKRKEIVYNVLKLFIGEGNPYDYVDVESEQRIHSTGVKIKTSDAKRPTTRSQKLKSYLYKLYNPETGRSSMLYTKISIKSATVIRVDSIIQVDDSLYKSVAYIYPRYIYLQTRQDNQKYQDFHQQTVTKIVINGKLAVDLPSGGTIFEIKLGDIEVIDNERILSSGQTSS